MSLFDTKLRRSFGIEFPLIVAPMAGGPTTVDLVVAVSEAGGLGSLAGAYRSTDSIMDDAQQIRSRTRKPFAINLFIPTPFSQPSEEKVRQAILKTQKFRDEVHLKAPALTPPFQDDFDDQFETVLRIKPQGLSFIFGVPSGEHIRETRERGILLIGTATKLEEARELEDAGVDAVVAQGIEAGGHRGIFDPLAEDPGLGTLDLLRALKGKIHCPLIAAGGLMNSRHIEEALKAGAEAVQMGTAFLATKEAGTSAPYRRKLLESPVRQTKTTRAFSGRLARGVVNRFLREMEAAPEAVLPFPVQNKFTRDLRNASAAANSEDFLSLWAGTGEGELFTGSAGDLIRLLFHY